MIIVYPYQNGSIDERSSHSDQTTDQDDSNNNVIYRKTSTHSVAWINT